jgi:hypothetical protein
MKQIVRRTKRILFSLTKIRHSKKSQIADEEENRKKLNHWN